MALLGQDSFDYYTDIAQRYNSASTAIISASAGRKNTAGAFTVYNSTFFLEDLVLFGDVVESLTLVKGISFHLLSLPPSGRCTILQFMELDFTPHVAITVDDTGIIEAYRGTQAGTLLASAVDPIDTTLYYDIEVKAFIDNAAGTVEVRLWTDETTSTVIINFTGDTQNGGTGLLSEVGYGTDGTTLTDAIPPSAFWDDSYSCDDTGSAFNDFQGNKHIEAKLPNGQGFYTTWVPVPSIPNYANVDENPPNTTDYNYAPYSSSVVSPSLRSTASVTDNPTCPAPAGIQAGDLLFAVIRIGPGSLGGLQQPSPTECDPPWPVASEPDERGVIHNFTPPPGSTIWNGSTFVKVATASEPTDYTFYGAEGLQPTVPLVNVVEIAILCYEGVNLAIPVEDESVKAATVSGTTVSFNQVNALTDNDLIVAVQYTETDAPPTPAGYAADYTGTKVKVASKVNPTAGGVIVPSTTLGGAQAWATDCYSLKAQAEIVTGSKDTFDLPATSSPTVNAVVVNLCTEVDSAGHTVGAVTRYSATDDESFGIAPTTDFKIYQFPYETAPDAAAWSTAKFNATEVGYALDAEEPPIPPAEAVIFWVDADDLDATYNDGDPITSIVETGMHTYTLTLAHAISGDYVAQTFQTGVAAVNGQDSIEGFMESLTCTPSTRNTGYKNVSTNSDLFLPDAFTLIAVVNLSQLDGCWSNGNPMIITRRGNDAGADFTGWGLTISGNDPPGTGTITFSTWDASFSTLCSVIGTVDGIVEGTTYIITVICDGTTLSLRVDGVEQANTAYVVGTESIVGNDLWFLNNGDGVDPVQGQTPYTKIWSIELQPADLAAEESALATKYQ